MLIGHFEQSNKRSKMLVGLKVSASQDGNFFNGLIVDVEIASNADHHSSVAISVVGLNEATKYIFSRVQNHLFNWPHCSSPRSYMLYSPACDTWQSLIRVLSGRSRRCTEYLELYWLCGHSLYHIWNQSWLAHSCKVTDQEKVLNQLSVTWGVLELFDYEST